MKNLIAFLALFCLVSMSSCIIDSDDDYYGPACEYDYTGTVCFVNSTDRDIEVNTAGLYLDVWAFTTQCLELSDGFYGFTGRAGFQRWDGNYDVFVCEESRVYLNY